MSLTVSTNIYSDSLAPESAQEQLVATLERMGEGYFACDGEWRFVCVNAMAEGILGISCHELLGHGHWEVFPFTVGTRLEDEYRCSAAGESREFEYHYEPWDRWFHHRCFPRVEGGIVVYLQDITRLKQEADVLHESNDQLRLFITQAPAALAMFDVEMCYIAASQRWLDVFGLNECDITGLSHYAVFPEISETLKQVHRRGLNGETVTASEDYIERLDGRTQWHRWEVQPWHRQVFLQSRSPAA
jgi:PAS domain S-box-containing protein